VVALSSDKAYQPVSAYGQSKALAESLFLAANNTTVVTKFAVCRYGNIFGSTGSVVPLWRKAMERGESLRVTDPECTRFYMTSEQAVRLVLKTAVEMPKEIEIPELPAYRLGDLYEAMKDQEMIDSNYVVTGLPTWEKLAESMDANRCSQTARRMSVEELRDALDALS
jgi:UDP-N-acetylglucosamine 4,6-dehydratase